MDSEIAILVSHVTKRFRTNGTRGTDLLSLLGSTRTPGDFLALDDVSFIVRKGETVGVIGQNGSGKSTLLQLISGVVAPTTGTLEVRGRVAALLELGSGFNPELSGRENVYINGAILGFSKEQISARFESIEAFAGIGNFIDRPVKSYSNGMVVRLAFSVATSVEPQILIVDEALAVGDELFQRKCHARIEELKAAGATILFVSHSSNEIVSLCDRVVLMDKGRKLTEGTPKAVVGKYHQLLNASPDQAASLRRDMLTKNSQPETDVKPVAKNKRQRSFPTQDGFDPALVSTTALSYESHGAVISSLGIHNSHGQKVNCLNSGEYYKYQYKVRFLRSATQVRFGMLIKTASGVELGGASSANQLTDAIAEVKAETEITVECSFNCRLQSGIYYLNAGVSGDCGEGFRHLHRIMDGLCFRVNASSGEHMPGLVDFSVASDAGFIT